MNIQNIKNETIHKLTRDEIGALDLLNHGVFTYKGELKNRRQGWYVKKPNEWQVNFCCATCRVEFIKIEQTLAETEWAMRVVDMRPGCSGYVEYFNLLWGCDFIK